MTDFRVFDLCDVFGIEGLCYEYWWTSAAMRSIGKGSITKWDATRPLAPLQGQRQCVVLCLL